jgi:hypothetical protein
MSLRAEFVSISEDGKLCGSRGKLQQCLTTIISLSVYHSENTTFEKGQKKPWTVTGVWQIGKAEGFSGLYKGFTPKVLRLAPGGGVLLLVVEVVLEQYRKFLGPPYL